MNFLRHTPPGRRCRHRSNHHGFKRKYYSDPEKLTESEMECGGQACRIPFQQTASLTDPIHLDFFPGFFSCPRFFSSTRD